MSDTNDAEKLRAERDALEKQVEKLEARPARRRKVRTVLTAILVILAVLCFTVAVPGLWARRTIFNTERYVETVAPLASDPAVQEYLARTITEQAFTALDVEDRLREVLQQRDARLAFLAGPLADGLRGVIQSQLQNIFASDEFAQTWASLNRTVQVQLIAVLENKSSTVQIVNDAVVLNVLPLINQALQSISGTISDLIGHPVTLPTITGDEIPSAALSQLQSALGVTLPTDFGSIVIYRSSSLSEDPRHHQPRAAGGRPARGPVPSLLGPRAVGLTAPPPHAAATRDRVARDHDRGAPARDLADEQRR